jgi:hypothetical protein
MQNKEAYLRHIVTTLFLIAASATTATSQFAFEGGLNAAKLGITIGGRDFVTTFKLGAAIGILADLEVDQHIFFQPGLFLRTGGAKLTNPTGDYNITSTDLQFYIQYKTGDRCSRRFFMGAGPCISFYTSGSFSYAKNGNIPAAFGDLRIGPNAEDDLKNRGLGIGFNIGYLPKRHSYFKANFVMGLSNLKPVGDADNKIKSLSAGLTYGFFLGGCSSQGYGSAGKMRKPTHWRGLSKGVYSTRPRPARYPQ